MRRRQSRLAGIVALIILAALWPTSALGQPACRFVLGFAALRDLVGSQKVGTCLDDEHFNLENGNAEQRTSGGLLVWRKVDNFTAFTDGGTSWINGPNGLQSRANSERFSWEKEPAQTVPSTSAIPPARVSTPSPQSPPAPAAISAGTTRAAVEIAALRGSDLPQGYSSSKAEWSEKGAYTVVFEADVATVLRGPMRADVVLLVLPSADIARQVAETHEIDGAEHIAATVKGAGVSRGFQSIEDDPEFTFKVSSVVFSVKDVTGVSRVQGVSAVTNISQASALAERVVNRLTGGQPAGATFQLAPTTGIGTAPAAVTPSASQSRPRGGTLSLRDLDGVAVLIANDGTYLGQISSNSLGYESVCNRLGQYGSDLGYNSVRNKLSPYGSAIGAQSAYNALASSPPSIILQGQAVGYLTKNRLLPGALDPDGLFVALNCAR